MGPLMQILETRHERNLLRIQELTHRRKQLQNQIGENSWGLLSRSVLYTSPTLEIYNWLVDNAWTALYECITECLCDSFKMMLLLFDMTTGLRTSILHNHLTTTYFLFNLQSFKNTDMLSYYWDYFSVSVFSKHRTRPQMWSTYWELLITVLIGLQD